MERKTWEVLLKEERKRYARPIKKTRYPFFNLVRLVRGPYDVISGKRMSWVRMIVRASSVPLGSAFAIALNRWTDQLPMSFAVVVSLIISAFISMHLAFGDIWWKHRKELKALRDKLLAKTAADHLVAACERIIAERREALIGEKSPLTAWLQRFEGGSEEVRSAEEALHEQSRVRVAYRASDRHEEARALKKWAAEECDLLIQYVQQHGFPGSTYHVGYGWLEPRGLVFEYSAQHIYDQLDHIAARLTHFVEDVSSDHSDTDPIPDAAAPGKRSVGNS